MTNNALSSPSWQLLSEDRPVYRYVPPADAVAAAGRMPVLFLHAAPHTAWEPFAERFTDDGFGDLYALQMSADSDRAALLLGDLVEWLLATRHPDQGHLIIVGCQAGGLLARRYVMLGGYERAAYLFTLGSAHRYSPLAYLRATIFESSPGTDEPPPLAVPSLSQTIIVNLYGDATLPTPGAPQGDPSEGVYLPEAINVGLPLAGDALCRDVLVYQEIRHHLQQALWLVTVRLMSLNMRGQADIKRTGPFCFEINQRRAPFDGAFRVPVGENIDFEAPPLLATLPFPLKDEGRAVKIDFRLKDLSPMRTLATETQRPAPRRKLVASLHTPLRDGVVNEQLLQDSLGSEIGIQMACCRSVPVF